MGINSFDWYFNTRIIFGSGRASEVGQHCAQYGKKVLLVRDGGDFLDKCGLMKEVEDSLTATGLAYQILDKIQPNPVLSKVYEGIKQFRDMNADFILALGGGSAIDTAKAIAAGVDYEGDVWDFFVGKAKVNNPPPVGVLLTIAATGSEGSLGCVITNEATKEKYDVLDEKLRPVFAILDPVLTLSLSPFQTACGVVDIFSHAMERYFTDSEDVELTDRLGEAVMKTTINNGLILLEDPSSLEARAQLMWAGTLAHNGLLEGGRSSSWAAHAIATELSAHYGITHGASLSVIIPAWMRYIYQNNVPRFARFASEVMNVEYDHFRPNLTAERGIQALEHFFRDLDMPLSLTDLQITEDHLFPTMAKSATRFGPVGTIKKLSDSDVVKIYEMCR